MVDEQTTANALQAKEELRRIGRRRRALSFKRKGSSFATAEQWAHCIEHPRDAKAICGREWIVCLVCRQLCKTLGLHLKPHNVSPEWYRELFGYPADEALISEELADQLGRLPDKAPRGTEEELAKAREGRQTLRTRKWILCPGSKSQPCGLKLRQITVLHAKAHGFETLNAFRDEWLYPYKTPLCCEELSDQARTLAKANKKFKPGVKGIAPAIRRKGYKMSRVFSERQSVRLMGKKRSKPKPKPKPKRGKGKRTEDLLHLCAAFEKIAQVNGVDPNVYAMAPVLYPLGPTRDQEAAEAATRLMRKRNRKMLDGLTAAMTSEEASRRIENARQYHP
jgi:predicted transcriptional regulator